MSHCMICGKQLKHYTDLHQCISPELPPVPRCLGCRDRHGVASYLDGESWVTTRNPVHWFGEVTFVDVECPICASEK